MNKTILFLMISFLAASQNLKRNTVSVQILGNSPLLSVNYDRKVKVSDAENRFVNIGIGTDLITLIGKVAGSSSGDGNFLGVISTPHRVTYNLGKNGKFLEAGYAGVMFGNGLAPGVLAGIRVDSKRGICTRVHVNKLYTGLSLDSAWPVWGGLSLGKSF